MNALVHPDHIMPGETNVQFQADPDFTIDAFFDLAHLHEVKRILLEIKNQLVNNSFEYRKGSVPYLNTVYFFERLEQFIEAVYQSP